MGKGKTITLVVLGVFYLFLTGVDIGLNFVTAIPLFGGLFETFSESVIELISLVVVAIGAGLLAMTGGK